MMGDMAGNHSAHGIASDSRALNAQMIHKPHDVFNHVDSIRVFGLWLVGLAVPTAIHRDDLEMFRQ